jgi:Asp-tRNA(Asn)/Glu-tRNA(Gln) amidotransferase A subunit family amidase
LAIESRTLDERLHVDLHDKPANSSLSVLSGARLARDGVFEDCIKADIGTIRLRHAEQDAKLCDVQASGGAATFRQCPGMPEERRAMPEPFELSALEARRKIADGSLTSEILTASCLERIKEREASVQAWAFISPRSAIEEARRRDREPSRGLLHGLPIGVKDIIDTADMATAYGSPIYRDHRPAGDAACVIRARTAGAVVLGKTHTTEFAWVHPTVTRNPHNPEHTPGGSSSGSAAGVADLMMPLAFATQTGGSTLRPASFCGIVGFKPTFDRYDTRGVKPLAPATDTIGLHARLVTDVALFDAALTGENEATLEPLPPRRIGLCRTPMWSSAEPATVAALSDAATALAAEGTEIVDVEAEELGVLAELNLLLMRGQAARTLAWEYANRRDEISKAARDLIARGAELSSAELRDAEAEQRRHIAAIDRLLADCDVILTPSAPGEAPRGLTWAGNSVFNRAWTTCHVPCITLPAACGPSGLPVGIQLVSRRGADRKLLAHALWAEQRLT